MTTSRLAVSWGALLGGTAICALLALACGERDEGESGSTADDIGSGGVPDLSAGGTGGAYAASGGSSATGGVMPGVGGGIPGTGGTVPGAGGSVPGVGGSLPGAGGSKEAGH